MSWNTQSQDFLSLKTDVNLFIFVVIVIFIIVGYSYTILDSFLISNMLSTFLWAYWMNYRGIKSLWNPEINGKQ